MVYNNIMKKFSLEHFTWLIIAIIALLVGLLFPWYVASSVLPYITVLLVLSLSFWYTRQRKLYQEAHSHRIKLLNHIDNQSSRHKLINKVITHLPDGILLLDENKRISFISPALEKLIGYKNEEVAGLFADQILHLQETPGNQKLTEIMFANKRFPTEQTVANIVETRAKKEIIIEARCLLVHDPKEDEYSGLAMIRPKGKSD